MSEKNLQDSRIDHIYKLVEMAARNLDKVRDLLEILDKEKDKDKYKEIPGVTGVFDGYVMVTASGERLEVPVNYAAKSRIVFGDTLKRIDEDGKQIFKQVEKVKRKKIEGILTKKEGKWYILSDAGTYKVSDTAADFYGAKLNDEASAYIPEENLNAPFATLDRVKTDNPTPSQMDEHGSDRHDDHKPLERTADPAKVAETPKRREPREPREPRQPRPTPVETPAPAPVAPTPEVSSVVAAPLTELELAAPPEEKLVEAPKPAAAPAPAPKKNVPFGKPKEDRPAPAPKKNVPFGKPKEDRPAPAPKKNVPFGKPRDFRDKEMVSNIVDGEQPTSNPNPITSLDDDDLR